MPFSKAYDLNAHSYSYLSYVLIIHVRDLLPLFAKEEVRKFIHTRIHRFFNLPTIQEKFHLENTEIFDDRIVLRIRALPMSSIPQLVSNLKNVLSRKFRQTPAFAQIAANYDEGLFEPIYGLFSYIDDMQMRMKQYSEWARQKVLQP